MKNLKKLTAVLFLAIMAISLTACGAEKKQLKILETEYIEEQYAIAVNKGESEFLTEVDNALKEITENGTAQKIVDKYINGTEHNLEFQKNAEGKEELRMGTNAEFPPYEFYDGDKIVGIDAEMAAAIADVLDRKLVIDDMSFDAIIPSITSGKIDMGMAGLTVNEDRKIDVDFTTSYATGVQVIIVPEDSEITSVDDLFVEGKNYNIGVQTMTTGDLYSTMDLEDTGLAKIQRYNKGADAVAALASGKIDCVIIDNEPAKAFVEANNK